MTPGQFDELYDMIHSMIRHEIRMALRRGIAPDAAWSQDGTLRERHEACARAKASLVENTPEDTRNVTPDK